MNSNEKAVSDHFRNGFRSGWLGNVDSNHDYLIQSQACYRCTIPQSHLFGGFGPAPKPPAILVPRAGFEPACPIKSTRPST